MHLKTDTGVNAHYASVPYISKPRNAFSVAEKHVTTIQFDKLFPIAHKYIYPGDTLSVTESVLARLQTQIAVLYDDLYLDLHAWFVPMRLLQTNWARYQFNAQPLGPSQNNDNLTSPWIDFTQWGNTFDPKKSLYDYFGFPTVNLTNWQYNSGANPYFQHVNNYLARAYNLIWNENYRDENLQNPAIVDLGEGPDNPANYFLRNRGKRHDKFTSALTAQQKGPAALIPLGTSAPIRRLTGAPSVTLYQNASNTVASAGALQGASGGGLTYFADSGGNGVSIDPRGSLYADLNLAAAATVNQWRQSVAVQHLLEADARGGTRDVESLQHRWGVTVPDFRLQRPEYLGGTTFSFDGHIVPQTSETGTTPQANLTQFSQTVTSFNINHSFVEHGVFMILLSARSNITYQQGLQRELSYRTRFSWYQPEFANLGEVAILNKEIFAEGGTNAQYMDSTFGFNEYGYELRYGENRVSSEMRSNYPQSLDSRHMADDYASIPTLSDAWIQSNTPISRNIAVSAAVSDPIQLNCLMKGVLTRTLPMYSVPGLTRL